MNTLRDLFGLPPSLVPTVNARLFALKAESDCRLDHWRGRPVLVVAPPPPPRPPEPPTKGKP